MDPVLMEIYGTNQEVSSQDEATQKLAAALDEEGIDFDALSPEEQKSLLTDLQSEGSEAPEGAEEAVEGEKTAEALFNEADQMGRIMAHAAHQEAQLIEQDELQKEAAKGRVSKAVEKAKKALKGGGKATMSYGRKGAKGALKAMKRHPLLAAGAAGAGGLGAGYGLGKKSADQDVEAAIEEAAEERALEMLQEAGYDIEAQQAE